MPSQMIDPSQRIYQLSNGQVHVETVNEEPTLTQQQFKDECDVNKIIKKYETTGEFTHRTSKVGQYADFSQITDYQEMVNTVQYANEAFETLPAEVRARFKNNPGELLDFIQDENNYDEGVKLGLLQKRPDDPKTTVPLIPSNPEPSKSKPSKTKIPTNVDGDED